MSRQDHSRKDREEKIIGLAVRGRSDWEIAEQLNVPIEDVRRTVTEASHEARDKK